MLASVDVNSVQNTDPETDIVSSPKKRKTTLDDSALSSSVPAVQMQKQNLVVDSVLEVNRVIASYEKETVSRFVSSKTDRGYNREEWQSKTKFSWRIKGFPKMDPSTPTIYLGCKLLACQHGKDRNLAIKRKWKERQDRKREQNEGKVVVHNRTVPTKKLDCPAVILIKKLALFPAYKVKNTHFSRKKAASMFRQDRKTNLKSMQPVIKYLVNLPDPKEHKYHSVGEGSDLNDKPVKEIVQEIESLAARKIKKVSIISQHLDNFLRNTLFKNKELPPKSKRAYYPSSKDIHNILYRYKCRNRSSDNELQQVEEMVGEWCHNHPEDQYFYQRSLSSEDGNGNTFMFCSQTKQQKQLLQLYGDLVVLDATYRTIGYSIPLYFLCVQTNVACQIVGMFVVHQEAEQNIVEALNIFKSWNPDWPVKYFMSDFGENEETALKTVFPDSKLFLTDYHRERRWEYWGKCSSNGMRDCREVMMTMLRRIADAGTTSDYLVAVAALTESQLWKNSIKFQEWVNSGWLPSSQRWVKAFKPTEMVFHIHYSFGLAFMNDLLPFAYLESYKCSTLSEMVEELVTSYMPTIYKRYEERNLECINGFLFHDQSVPETVRNTPTFVVENYISMLDKLASYSYDQVKVKKTEGNMFIVNIAGRVNTVYFGNNDNLPFCYGCPTWESNRLPCEHFHAVFQSQYTEWGWEQLSPKFRNYPCLVLDHSLIPSSEYITVTGDYRSKNDADATDAAYFVTCQSTNSLHDDDYDDDSSSISSPDVDCQSTTEVDNSTSLAQQCRQCLTEITDITFSLEDHNTLQNLLASLQQTKVAMKQSVDQTTRPSSLR
ncbi:uncharacterized protein LOC117108012 [Anneissia japonica]|uniref:uncharacterized protein LOC117108012 n=1 Tax=Anneissia japonica TaxID=1529436 RepID=UPI001425AC69|nr:uncharacterized protein LOC117108012 [Anneissia japonica]